MKKKFILFLALLFTTLNAATIHSNKVNYSKKDTVTIQFDEMTALNNDWIGIYPKESSNAWNNVVQWAWTNDIKRGSHTFKNLPVGEYEARLFFNNSFITEKKTIFTISNQNKIKNQNIWVGSSNEFTIYRLDKISDTNNDWIGVFPKNSIHNRKNLLAWGYISADRKKVTIKTLNNKKLDPKEYDMVYFLNDSYQQLGEVSTLKFYYHFEVYYSTTNGMYKLYMNDYKYVAKNRDWIAIFKKDHAPKKENIIAWAYIKDAKIIYEAGYKYYYFSNFPQKNIERAYKVYVFSNDSYKRLSSALVQSE